MLHHNGYDKEQTKEQVKLYDKVSSKYMLERTSGQSDIPWSAMMAKRIAEPARLHLKDFLQDKGFMKR
ncbi:nitroreductase A [compost metagenome]